VIKGQLRINDISDNQFNIRIRIFRPDFPAGYLTRCEFLENGYSPQSFLCSDEEVIYYSDMVCLLIYDPVNGVCADKTAASGNEPSMGWVHGVFPYGISNKAFLFLWAKIETIRFVDDIIWTRKKCKFFFLGT